MKRFASFSFILVVMVVTALTASPSFAAEFCWKDSYGRGAGTVPRSCASGQEMVGLFCYDECPIGMKRAGIDCHSKCPGGMADQGLFCRASELPRGAGYPWEFGDSLDLSGALSRCEKIKGKGKCEKWGAVIYPKCNEGYSNFGCCICRPAIPNCQRLGLRKEGQVDLSCAKEVKIASSPKLGNCEPGQERDAGLCYQNCRAGYYGVGPVCWKKNPWGWVDCGMGAAKDDETCASITINQISSVGQLAMSVATLGTSMVATKAATATKSTGTFAQLKQQYDNLVAAYEAAKRSSTPALQTALQTAENAYSKGSTVLQINTAANTALNIFTEADIARLAAQIAQIVDPSGVAGTIAGFTHEKCSKYFSKELYPEQDAQWVQLNTERSPNKLSVATYMPYPYNNSTTIAPGVQPPGEKDIEYRNRSWRVDSQGDGTVLLKSAIRGPGMCLGNIPGAPDKGNEPQLRPCSGDSPGQHWKLVQDGNWIRLKTLDRCLGVFVTGAPKAPTYQPVLQKCSDTPGGADPRFPMTAPGQHWKIDPSPYTGGGEGWTP